MIMRNIYIKYWLTCLLITAIHVWTTHSYGDTEYMSDDTNTSNKVTLESLVDSMNGKHRVKRALGDPTSVAPELTTQISISTNSSPIYIITGYSNSGVTIQTTAYTSQTTSASTTSSTTTNLISNATYIITNIYSSMTSTTTTTTTTTPITCTNGTYVLLSNGTCASRETLRNSALDILNSSSANDTDKANAISIYITAVTNSNISSNASNTLTIGQIDQILGNLTSTNYSVPSNDSVVLLTRPNPCVDDTIVIGASYEMNVGPTIIDTSNRNNVTDSLLSAAGVVNLTAQCKITSFNMLIINNPTTYQNIDNSTNKTLASSIVIATVNKEGYNPQNIVIQLYFQVLTPPNPNEDVTFLCTFYDTNASQWNDFGCSKPTYNARLSRYECKCYHLTSFALIWLPRPPSLAGKRPELDAQDKVSIAFQLISIVCFIGIIIHAITVRIMNPEKYIQKRHILPLTACGITMILFIFYIALCLTVYTRRAQSYTNVQTSTQQARIAGENINGKYVSPELNPRADLSSMNSSSSHIPCLPTEHALMFIVYFLIIFMFCARTSIGIDNYRRYVELFPPPSFLMLTIMIVSSVVISGIWLIVAVTLNSSPSNEISEVYLDKICWFNRNVIHYFLTIPICIFLAINLAMFIPVVIKNVHAINIEDDEKRLYYIRRRRCMYILLTSCVTQGFGWLLGPIMLAASPDVAEALAWIFVVVNALEGVWALLLYIAVEKEGMNDAAAYTDGQARRSNYSEIDVPQIQLDDREHILLANLGRDFTDLSETQTHRRSNQANNDDDR